MQVVGFQWWLVSPMHPEKDLNKVATKKRLQEFVARDLFCRYKSYPPSPCEYRYIFGLVGRGITQVSCQDSNKSRPFSTQSICPAHFYLTQGNHLTKQRQQTTTTQELDITPPPKLLILSRKNKNLVTCFRRKSQPGCRVNLTNHKHMGVSKNNGTPKSSISIGFSIINHPF